MGAVTAAFAQSRDEAQLLGRVRNLQNAIFQNKDSAALADLVSADVSYGHSSGVIEDKATMIHKAITNKTTYKVANGENTWINIQGNTAIVRQNLRAVQTDEAGKESPLDLGILQVWKKENGKWRIWARQAVKIPAKM